MGPQLILLVFLIALPLLRLGARQTSATLEGVVPRGGRLVAQQALGHVHALLVDRSEAFQLVMAYRVKDGWVGLFLPESTPTAEWAVEQSRGRAPVPAFTAAFGLLRGTLPGATATIRIIWNDGRQDVSLNGGGFLAVREGRFSVERVSLLDRADTPVRDLKR